MMKETLNIYAIQADLVWQDAQANRNQFDTYLQDAPSDSDVIIFPEMFTSGFTMHPELVAETMDGTTIQWLKHWAEEKNAAICGSLVISENNTFYNRFVFVTPDGNIQQYDKRHTFNMAGEGEVYTPGTSRVIFTYEGWKIMAQVCYDLRFPVFSRNTEHYDVVLYVANWPKTRVAAWDTLLKARAIENMAYSIGVNRTGTDDNGLDYVGHSGVYDVLGNTCAFAKASEKTITATLLKSHIETTRKALPFLQDADDFELKL